MLKICICFITVVILNLVINSMKTQTLAQSEFNSTINEAIANVGVWFNQRNVDFFGNMVDIRNNTKEIQEFEVFVANDSHKLDDHEAHTAVEKYFWGKLGGISLEIGALDGFKYSQTHKLFKNFGWHRILVEAFPQYKESLRVNSPDAYSFNAVCCSSAGYFHVINAPHHESLGGILEYMSEGFLMRYHKQIYRLPAENRTSHPHVYKVHIPRAYIFSHIKVFHVNFFILDVEGAELTVLKSINWEQIQFDIISVEIEAINRPTGYGKEVRVYLANRGYRYLNTIGRNAWFMHQFFIPSSQPTV